MRTRNDQAGVDSAVGGTPQEPGSSRVHGLSNLARAHPLSAYFVTTLAVATRGRLGQKPPRPLRPTGTRLTAPEGAGNA
jgi:hypothetical protein